MKSIKFLVVIIAILTSNNSNAQKGKRTPIKTVLNLTKLHSLPIN